MIKEMRINEENIFKFFNDLAYDNENTIINNIYINKMCNKQVEFGFNIQSYMDIHKCLKNLKLIYSNDKAIKCMNMINDMQIIFNKYFKIMGLERLIATNYTDLEWSMVLEYNFEKSESQRTRDHFIHQFRNAFLGCTFLSNFGLDEKIVSCIKGKQTQISYIINKVIENMKIKNELKEDEEEHIYKEIIYKSYILSAIFHDIGYPISYFNRVSSQIHKFTPFYEMINCNIKTDFTKIKCLLADSMLLLTVDNDQIREKYEKNDHGVFSAISFLLNFYSSGSIHSLSEVDRCIIELAAISIYKHTNKYNDDERMLFYDDPISYLLRLCDDLQEWSRLSLNIDNNNNFLRCNKCLGTMRPQEDDEKQENVVYKCNRCGITFEKITQIDYKKINYLEFGRGIVITPGENDDEINIKIEYDPYVQLELLTNDYLSVKYRNNDLKKIEKMLEFQKELPIINIKWELSNNPYLLVKWILEKKNINIGIISIDDLVSIAGLKAIKHRKICEEFIEALKTLKDNGFGENQILTDVVKYHSLAKEFVYKYIGIIEYINTSKVKS